MSLALFFMGEDSFVDRVRAGRPLLLDSAMGTELERRGAATRLPLDVLLALADAS